MDTLGGVSPDDFRQDRQRDLDAALLVKFFVKPVMDEEASKEAGRPIYRDVEYVDIRAPGSRDNVCRPASPHDKERFDRHYAAFKNRTQGDDRLDGTPLAEWPLINRSRVEELAFFNVKTVEQLVAMSDANAQNFMGLNTLRAEAKRWLEAATKAKEAMALQEELSKRDAEIEQLKTAIAELQKPKTRKKKVTAKKE